MVGPGRLWSDLPVPHRLCHQNLSFLTDRRLARILALAGHPLRLGLPGPDDGVLVWGRSPTAARGEAVAARRKVPLVRAEDAFLRSVHPGRTGTAPLGLILDPIGVHFDAAAPSLLERILATDPLDDSNILSRARQGIERIQTLHLSKYNIHDPTLTPPAPGYVLVVDQTQGDASIRHSGASASTFREMLVLAQEQNPGARIVIKAHPETTLGLRPGHFGPEDASPRVTLLTTPVSPWALLDGAIAVYTVSSHLGFEAILAGHRPHVLGHPFYAGWGLTQDATHLPRRTRSLTKTQLFAAAMILAPLWYDPCRDRLCSFEDALDQLEAEVRAFRQDRFGHVAVGMRLWKRKRLQQVFGATKPVIFRNDPTAANSLASSTGRTLMIWAGKEPPGFTPTTPTLRVEDGFLRSRGLGAALTPPLSLVTDDLGIYYDPTRPSRLEQLILAPLTPAARSRTERLLDRLTKAGLSKYNLATTPLPPLPDGRRILVPGQVEDDASILKGAGEIRTNAALLLAARQANPGAVILFKPHPDVEAGLRPGALTDPALADMILTNTDPAETLAAVDEVWTITSLLGFEALIRGKPVTTLGAPFYAGWGLTRDLGPVPARRIRRADGSLLPRPDVTQLAHAALIAYPRYWDPVSRRPCPPEVIVDRLIAGALPQGPGNWLLARLQGRFASLHRFWR
ncbi:capsular polysaccharide biosynthesis protein [Tabrizicola sp. BL-A-41-H6]|uniref:capsular polysaccharide biosynthesis protein n=1 Tax=Tabrizicola sp. BL-A-41-H6 TaxID=3421107 RepID=UPI003D668419